MTAPNIPGCCAASQVAILDALKQRYSAELNPEVRRGIIIAIVAVKSSASAGVGAVK